MKYTKLALTILTVGYGFSTLALAQDGYTSSQTSNDADGYYSSQTPPQEPSGGYMQYQTQQTSGDNAQTTVIYSSTQPYQKRNRGLRWEILSSPHIPKNAIVGGHEKNGKLIYICAAPFHGGLHPGKVVGFNCNIGYGGKEIISPLTQVLVSSSYFSWTSASDGQIPQYAFAGGREKGRPLYICQARYAGGVHPGKVVGANCNITYGGNEVTVPRYSVLVSG